MKKIIAAIAFSLALTACGYVDKYEEGVIDYEPTYCYAALGGGVECYREPVAGEDRRLVNYYGKHPSRYDAPEKPAPAEYQAPAMVNSWVKDPEPVIRAMPKGDTADRPWLASGYQAPAPKTASPQATQALLRQAHEHLSRTIRKDSQAKLNRMNETTSQAESEGAGTSDETFSSAPPFR
ncbi:MAG TPA: hypothetical protein DCG48_01760 [Rhodospirillaceae bacterium]|nr:hypothetical protein [Rhodospirillaceae bacterium]|tara:strand:- start:3 stop:542 length:540 start_codon:yes stop_codon:yes gene_type:complete